MNKVILCGRLGADPEMRFLPSGREATTLSVATNLRWKGADGEQKQRVDWHTVEVFGATAVACSQYLSKGRQVLVEGRIQYDKVEQPDGSNKYFTKIIATSVRFLGSANGHGNEEVPPTSEDEIPF